MKRDSELPTEVLDLLSVIPKRQYFNTNLLDAQKLVNFLNDQVEIPTVESTKSG
uniref:mRNA 3'-end-processing protein RNA14 n=1 Tax=Saccharomyces cerevisiae TaxID=4932 RepID=UPI0002080B96|nr:Chain B, mRNA 3'-end-processing protein RNA14 [Saccharomyces cerevisiae]